MKPETELIWKLVGKLIGGLGSAKSTNTTKGKTSLVIEKRIDQYHRSGVGGPIWTYADHDIIALIAVADLIWEKKIESMASKDENRLQEMFGVNALSERATSDALYKMNLAAKDLKLIHEQCKAMPPLAYAIVVKTAMGGPANASQIAFDKNGADRVKKLCEKNIRSINKILGKLDNIIPLNERIVYLHRNPGINK